MKHTMRKVRSRLARWRHTRGVDNVARLRRRRPEEFEELRNRIRALGTDSLSHFGNGYTHEGGLSLQQNPDELASLCVFLRERRPFENYMEIGSASGGTCYVLSKEVGFKNTLSLDDGRHPRAAEQARNFSQVPNVKQFIGDSHTEAAVDFLRKNVAGKLDVSFIDGDHSYEGVWQDVNLTLPFCRPGTLVIFHDTLACDGVERAWLRCIEEGRLKPLAEYIGAEKPLGIAVGKVI